jgi:hypothetical protein
MTKRISSSATHLSGEFGEARPLAEGEPRSAWHRTRRFAALFALLLFIAFWTWAIFFASKEAFNRFDDRAWAERAEATCAAAQARRAELADYRRVDASNPELLKERGAIIDASTDLLEEMLDRITSTLPTDAKGAELVPQWEADYRIYLENRRAHAQATAAGANEPFREARRDNLPISERLEVFATDNEMPSCAPPRDL